MGIIVKDSRRDWTPAPEGLHQGVCVDVVDLGLIATQWGEKHKVRIIFQLEHTNPDTSKRFEVRRDFGLSLSEKSHLRPTLEAWRGRKFTKEELDGFDLEKLLGANCQVQVVHNITDDGNVYANIQAIVPLGRGMVKLSPADYIRVQNRPKAQGNGGEKGAPAHGDDEVPF